MKAEEGAFTAPRQDDMADKSLSLAKVCSTKC